MRVCLLFVLVGGAMAHAYPTLAPRPIASGIAGPADPHVGAAYMNPAALGPLHGVHFWMEAGPRIHVGSIERAANKGSASIGYTDFDAFIGATWDFGTDRFTAALSTIVPFNDLASFGDSPVRYHSLDQIFVTYQQSLSVAGRISSRFYIGANFNVAETWMQSRFARDAAISLGSPGVHDANGPCGAQPCGFENPLARQTIRLRGFGVGYGFSLGVLGRATDRLWLAASYISHFFTGDAGDDVLLQDARGTRVSGVGCSGLCVGNSRVAFYLPDIVQAAARVEVSPKVELEATLRYIHYGIRPYIDWTAQGGNLVVVDTSVRPPPQSRRDLGLQDTFGAEVSARLRVGERLRLMPSLFFETSSVDGTAVSAAALDAPKLDLALVAEWRPVKHLVLGAHVGATAYIIGNVTSRHDPNDTVSCVDQQYNLEAVDPMTGRRQVCRNLIAGDGLPSASGQYTVFTIHLGAALGVEY